MTILPYFIMQMVACAVPGGTHQGDHVPALHAVPGLHQKLGIMPIVSLKPTAMLDHHQPSKSALPGRHPNEAVRRRLDRRAQAAGNVQPVVKFAFDLLKRITPLTKSRRHPSRHRPAQGRGPKEFALVLDIVGNVGIIGDDVMAGLLHIGQLPLHVFDPQRRTAAGHHVQKGPPVHRGRPAHRFVGFDDRLAGLHLQQILKRDLGFFHAIQVFARLFHFLREIPHLGAQHAFIGFRAPIIHVSAGDETRPHGQTRPTDGQRHQKQERKIQPDGLGLAVRNKHHRQATS